MTSKLHYFIGTGAAGGVVTPTPVYGDFLTTHGIWVMSIAEWMKVVGTIYIILLIISLIIKTASYINGRLRSEVRSEQKEATVQDAPEVRGSNRKSISRKSQ